MDIKDLIKFVDNEEKYIQEKVLAKSGKSFDIEKRILVQNLKLTEEVGELTNEILLNLSLARKSKIDGMDKNNVNEELADVLIVTMLLAKLLNIDVEKALSDKINKLNERREI